jgi:hypothetical protein
MSQDLTFPEILFLFFIVTIISYDIYLIGKFINSNITVYIIFIICYLLYYMYCVHFYDIEPVDICDITIKLNSRSNKTYKQSQKLKEKEKSSYIINSLYNVLQKKSQKQHIHNNDNILNVNKLNENDNKLNENDNKLNENDNKDNDNKDNKLNENNNKENDNKLNENDNKLNDNKENDNKENENDKEEQ